MTVTSPGGTPSRPKASAHGYVGSGWNAAATLHPKPPAQKKPSAPGAARTPTPAADPQTALEPPPVHGAWESDPVLISIRGVQETARANANISAHQAQVSSLLDYGDPELASKYLGADDPNVKAAKDNPFSVLAQLAKAHERTVKAISEQNNQQHTFYSGHHIQDQADEQTGYLQGRYNASRAEGSALGGIEGTRLSALGAADAADQQALTDAYNRHLYDAPVRSVLTPPPAAKKPLTRPRQPVVN